jgi:hypothetical protein
MGRIILLFIYSSGVLAAAAGAGGLLGVCAIFYIRVEGLRALDAPFWAIPPHAIEYRAVHKSTKIFLMFVYAGVFTLQFWIAERVLLTIFSRHGVEAWRTVVNKVNVDRLRDHFLSAATARSAAPSSTTFSGWSFRSCSSIPMKGFTASC